MTGERRWRPTAHAGVVAAAVLLALFSSSLARGARSLAVSAPFNVPCGDIAGATTSPRQGGFRVVLGVISVAPENASDKTVDLGGKGWRYWEKSGVFVRTGKFTVTVTVPKAWRSRAAITWGNNEPLVGALEFSGCADGASSALWSAYAGGFYLRARSACVPLVFSVEGRSTTVRFGVGRHCR
jgi:hypothetical protein